MQHDTPAIAPNDVRYIKLGEGGAWEAECIRDGTLRFGFDTGDPKTMDMCIHRQWRSLRSSWAETRCPSTATRFTNETRIFFEDIGTTLWVTFVEDRLYWGFLKPSPPLAYDGDSSIREVMGGWSCCDVRGEELVKSNLSGSIVKLAAYRGTSCNVDVADKLVRRINAEKSAEAETALRARNRLVEALLPLVRSLHPSEFENLVDLVFAASGWRRLGKVGGTQKTTDFDLELPSTGEHAFVQVKSRANQSVFDGYVERAQNTSASRMFFVYHSGDIKTDATDVTLINGTRIAEMAVDAGLTDWIIEKAS